MGDIGSASFERVPDAIPVGRAAALAQRAALSRYSLPEAEFAAWRMAASRTGREPVTVAQVNIVGADRVNPEFVRQTLQRLFPTAAGCCISHVSEYRDAMFNSSQLKNLEQEISTLEPMAEDEKGEWIQLKSMVRTAAEKGNLYMRFYGEPEKG